MTPLNWTYCGLMFWNAWGVAFLVNLPGGTTRVLFSYQRKHPVRIVEVE
jgi:hypothetical protein